MKRLFIDMDGVLAEYRKSCNEKELAKKNYFLTLKPEVNMLNAIEMLVNSSEELGYSVHVLTKVYPKMFKHSVDEKLQWRDEYMPFLYDSEFIMVDGEKEEKSQAIKELLGCSIDESCILVDDYNFNLTDWASNGGTSVKFVNNINDKNHSFVGNRISYDMSAFEIYSALLSIMNLTTTRVA